MGKEKYTMEGNDERNELAEFSEGEKFKRILMSEYFAADGYEISGEKPLQNESLESKRLEENVRYGIYREVQHELYVEDAKEHVREYIEWRIETGQDPLNPKVRFDYDHLANLFEDMRDCNQADNDIWDNIIDRIVRAHEMVQQRGAHTIKNIMKKDKGESIRQSHNRSGCMER